MDDLFPTTKKYDEFVAPLYRARNQAILKMRDSGVTLAEIGRLFNISRERVRQIIENERKHAAEQVQP